MGLAFVIVLGRTLGVLDRLLIVKYVGIYIGLA